MFHEHQNTECSNYSTTKRKEIEHEKKHEKK